MNVLISAVVTGLLVYAFGIYPALVLLCLFGILSRLDREKTE